MPRFIIEKRKIVSRDLKLSSLHHVNNLKSTDKKKIRISAWIWIQGCIYHQVRCGARKVNLPEDVKLVSVSFISKQSNFYLTSYCSSRQCYRNSVSPACTRDRNEFHLFMHKIFDPYLRFLPLTLRDQRIRNSTCWSTT